MASIKKRGEGYEVRWWTIGGKQRKRTCPSRRVAEQLNRDIEAEKALGRDWEPEGARDVPDIAEVAKAFIEHQRHHLAPVTLRRYGENLDIFIRFVHEKLEHVDGTGPMPVTLLSKPLLDEYYGWLCLPENGLHGNQREPDTARKVAEVFQLCWKWAWESERWPEQIPPPRMIKMKRSKRQPVVAPMWWEMDACVLAARGWHQKLALFQRYTGLRVGAVMLYEWEQLNEEAGTLTIPAHLDKTGFARVVPLSPHLLAELRAWPRDGKYIIPSGRRTGARERQARARDIARAWSRAGVRPEAWRQPDHAFRKGWKTEMVDLVHRERLGVGHLLAIRYLMGHEVEEGSSADYVDGTRLPLFETVALVPKIGAIKKPKPKFASVPVDATTSAGDAE